MDEDDLANAVIEIAIEIVREIGPTLDESICHSVFLDKLRLSGVRVTSEAPIPTQWKWLESEVASCVGFMVDGKLVVEIKSVQSLSSDDKQTVLNHLYLTKCRLGLLINFGEDLSEGGIHRIVNGLPNNQQQDT
ncbi:MAG TPA: GxxExxY protein [Planctomicrobium sp.]|nr:GxxExxY protein [Planctomicrobium sp.]